MCSQNPENRLLFTGRLLSEAVRQGFLCLCSRKAWLPSARSGARRICRTEKEKCRCVLETGVLNPESNVQFGEGGAGTFSDGKLNTSVKDPSGRNREVLRIFTECGAPEEILYDQKPHLGTDQLIGIVTTMRKRSRHGAEKSVSEQK